MDAERALLSKIIHTGAIEQVIAQGIDSDHFGDKECREVYEQVVDHVMRYRSAPSFDAVRKMAPDFRLDVVSDPLDYCLDEFKKVLKRRKAIESGRRLMAAIDDPLMVENIEEAFMEEARRLAGMLPAGRVARFSQMHDRIEDYKRRVRSGEQPMGITFGIPAFDEETFGIQPHEFVAIAGWQGLGKSTLSQHVLFKAYLEGRTAMIVSLEMEAQAILRKFDVMATNVRYKAMKALELESPDLEKWQLWAERAENAKNDIIILDDLGRNATLEKVYAEVVRYKPDIYCIDYITLLKMPNGNAAMWEKLTDLTRELKAMTRALCIPCIGVVQTNVGSANEGATLDTIAYSRSIGQDADIVLGLHQDKEGKMRAQKKMEVRLLKNRDGDRTTIEMFWDPSRMVFREWTAQDMFQQRDHHQPTQDNVVPMKTESA